MVTRIIPFGPHAAPMGSGTDASRTDGPPATGTLYNSAPTKKPTHWPSGEKNGEYAPSVPGIGVAVKSERSRR